MISLSLFSGDEAAVLQALSAAVVLITAIALVFAGTAIVVRFVTDHRADTQQRLWALWMPPILDAIADPVRSPFRHHIRRRDRLLFLELLARLSISLSFDERPQLAEMALPHLREARELLTDKDPEFRALGLQLLGLLGADENRDLLIRSMRDPAPLIALAAIRSLSRGSGLNDVEEVLEELPRFEKWGQGLLSALLVAFGDRARPVLRAVLADKARPERQRVAAAGALLKLNDLESSRTAEEVLRTYPGRELAAACLRLVRRLGRPVQADLLAHFAASDDPVVRLHAVSALATVGGDDHVDLLTMSMADPSHWVAMRASQTLKDLRRLDRLQWLAAMNHPRASLARELLGGQASHA